MEKVKNLALLILVLLLTGMTIRTCRLQKSNKTLQKELDLSSESLTFLENHPVILTDTVYREVGNIKNPEGFRDEVKPSRVIHPKNTESPDSVSGSSFKPSPRDSVSGISLNNNTFTLTFSNPSLGNHQSEFKIKPNEYQYTWVDGKLTAKRLSSWKRLEVKPYTSFSYRPFNNLWDLEAGISFKTKSLNYNLGVSGFYYPQWQSKPGIDAQIRITYNF